MAQSGIRSLEIARFLSLAGRTVENPVPVRATLDHFEIPVARCDRMVAFLKEVFGWPDAEVRDESSRPEARYRRLVAAVGPGPAEPALRVGLFEGPREVLDRAVPVVRLADERLEVCLARAVSAGGRVVLEPESIPGSGRFARFEDPEGNQWGLWEPSAD